MIEHKAARAMGIAGMGIGIAELVAPGWIGKKLGLSDKSTRILRGFGVRELLSGAGVIGRKNPSVGMWSRVAGDVIDVAALGAALRKSEKRGLLYGAIGAVLAIGALDLIFARRSMA